MGLLLGLQRERSQRATGKRGPAGARTFPIVALLGALAVLAGGGAPGWLAAVGFLGVAAPPTTAHVRASRDEGAVGLTTEVLLLLAYVLGAVAAAGQREAATVVGAAALVLVSLKDRLHTFAGRLSDEDEAAVLKFVAVALLVVPLLPDRAMGPFDAVNLAEMGKMVVLVAGISFLGYVAVKTIGVGRGFLVTGLFGGIASTTATTAAFARRSREAEALAVPLSAGRSSAARSSTPRILALVALVSPAFATRLIPWFLPMAVVTLAAAVPGLLATRRGGTADVPLENPLEAEARALVRRDLRRDRGGGEGRPRVVRQRGPLRRGRHRGHDRHGRDLDHGRAPLRRRGDRRRVAPRRRAGRGHERAGEGGDRVDDGLAPVRPPRRRGPPGLRGGGARHAVGALTGRQGAA